MVEITEAIKSEIVLPADIYDTLELSALVFNGIGAFHLFDENANPCCIGGHIDFDTSGAEENEGQINYRLMMDTFKRSFGGIAIVNDNAIVRINKKLGRETDTRVSWKQYCKELNIVRGE